MTWSDDTLMAYADGELDAAQRSALDHALAADATLRARVAVFQGRRRHVAAAFDPVLDEPVPERLAQLLQAPAVPPVADLASARAARDARRAGPPTWARTWAPWGGIAAGVLVGVLLGAGLGRDGTDTAFALRDGQLVAGGALARALSTQLASEPVAGAAVAVQLSFVDRSGAYCRTFSTAAVAGLAGLACRQGEAWAVQTLTVADAAPAGAVRQAASALPRAVLDAVDSRIGGDALDATAERQARDRGWRR